MEKIFIITSDNEIDRRKLSKFDKILVANPHLWHICNKKKINASLLSAELSISEITSCYEFANCIFEKDNFKKNDFDFVEFFRVYYWELFYEYKCLDIFFKKKNNLNISLNQSIKNIPSSHLEIVSPEFLLNYFLKKNYKNFFLKKKINIFKNFIKNLKRLKNLLNILYKNKKSIIDLPINKVYHNLFIASDFDLEKFIRLFKDKKFENENNLIFGTHQDKEKIINFFESKKSKVEFFDISLFIRLRSQLNLNKQFRVEEYLSNLLEKYDIKIDKKYFSNLTNDYFRANSTNNIIKQFLIQNKVDEIHLIDFNGFIERSIEQLSKNMNLKVNLYPHGWLGNPEAYNFNEGKYFYTGLVEREILLKQNKNSKFQSINKEQNIKPLSKKIDKILILSTRARNRFATNFKTDKFLKDWNLFLKTLKKNEKCEIHFKFHPNHNYKDWLINYLYENDFKNFKVIEGEVTKVTSNYDLVIDFGKPGSATRETLLSGTPLIIYTGLYRFDRGTNIYIFNSEYSYDNIDDLCSKINNCIKNPRIYLEEISINNKKLSKLINSI